MFLRTQCSYKSFKSWLRWIIAIFPFFPTRKQADVREQVQIYNLLFTSKHFGRKKCFHKPCDSILLGKSQKEDGNLSQQQKKGVNEFFVYAFGYRGKNCLGTVLLKQPQNRRAPRRLADVPHIGWPTWGTSVFRGMKEGGELRVESWQLTVERWGWRVESGELTVERWGWRVEGGEWRGMRG